MSEHQTRTPEQVRADIESTREDLGDTVEALADKTDVKGRARGRIDEIKANVGQIGSSSGAGSQSPQQQALAMAKENPAPIAIGGALLVGFLIGRRAAR